MLDVTKNLMNEATQVFSLKLGVNTPDGRARAKATHVGGEIECEPTALVNFSSAGCVFILGNDDVARQAAVQLAQHTQLNCTFINIDNSKDNPSIELEVIPSTENINQTGLSTTLQAGI